ncbi:short chain dehydrogenase [Salimicrobium jeotgali]|uniref:Short chain dehydrogenase n=1 Tax=Salimicrobium jeotgali TaxID=1230341 RepID=K2GCH3_9BACI|nr:glucose 1-dehydrogenase [Salimicrobium jeotgali]AKG04479.1 short chain dehydrogenase [Salimicrobium jeotgali]EKE32688.1 short-chain dehydrogenase/reductase SDR [Salimicrobium jeotgali]MBM7695326.1 NAD(P)-dependent dehydrogenase (short-subunit alcohol dehydrogenase family) [Salimicrobium jeotgali]
MTELLKGKAGLVTAAGSGIGRASAIALAKSGAKVMVSDVSEEGGKETVKMIRDNGGEAQFFKCDVSDEDQVKALVDETVSAFGKLDIAHNNAGINAGQVKIGEMESEDWDKTIKINLYGVFYCVKHQINAMLETGGGSIVNSASGSGLEGSAKMTPYTASKHGVVGLTKSVALEYGKQGIRINAIAPGATITPAIEKWAQNQPEQYNGVLESLPAGEMSTPEDQGNVVAFLCSDLAKQINGVTVPVDGGYTAGKL